jgi:hypothetical protein
MIKVKLKTRIGSFVFNTYDKSLIKKINSLQFYQFDIDNKTYTVFSGLLKTAKLEIL